MPKLLKMNPSKTYATEANAVKAVEKAFGADAFDGIHYMVVTNEQGRFFPVFIGGRAIDRGIHFQFCVVN